MYKILFTTKLLAAFLVLSVGLYELGKHGGLPAAGLGKIPLVKNAVDFTTGVGDKVETISMKVSHTAGELFGNGAKRAEVLDQYPVLQSVGNTASKLSSAVSNTFFPSESVKKAQAKAKSKMNFLDMELAEKQKQLALLNNQVARLHDEIHALDDTANPIKSLIPNGANFLSLGPAPKASTPARTMTGAPFIGPNSSAPTLLGAPFMGAGSSPPTIFGTRGNSGSAAGQPNNCICP
jgi:hypothetical protein